MIAKVVAFLYAKPKLSAGLFCGAVIVLATILHPDAAGSAVLGAFGLIAAILGLGGVP